MINRWVTDEKDRLTVFDHNGPYLATKKIGKNNPKAEQIEKDNKLRMDWNREVDRAIISEVSMDDILQIKREHITEPVKRSIERYGNKPEMLSLILNMAIAELVLLITKVLEAIKGIHSRLQRENAPEDKNKAQKQDNGILTADALPPEPVMTPEAAAYPKLKNAGMLIRIIRDNTKAGRMPAENRIHLRIRMKNCRINLQDYKGKPLKTRTVSAGRQRTEGQDNMPFVLYSFDGITIEYWNLA